MREPDRHVICSAAELPPGSRQIVAIAGKQLGVFNVAGTYRALRNVCPHHLAPLCLGPVTEEITSPGVGRFELREGHPVLRCPWHGFEFDMETGRNLTEPDRYRVAVYDVRREEDEIVVYL